MQLNLQGRVALVTGAASGIGAATARALAREGCSVIAADIRGAAAEAVARELAGGGMKARAISLDVADSARVTESLSSLIAADGTVEILVACAGVLKQGALAEMSADDWRDVERVNVAGVLNCLLATVPEMARRRYGRVVTLASTSAFRGGGALGNALYGASKAAVVALTQAFAREYTHFGVTVNAIAPGVTESPMTGKSLEIQSVRERVLARIPAGRVASVDEIANVAVFLASDAARYVTGTVVTVDGGYLLT